MGNIPSIVLYIGIGVLAFLIVAGIAIWIIRTISMEMWVRSQQQQGKSSSASRVQGAALVQVAPLTPEPVRYKSNRVVYPPPEPYGSPIEKIFRDAWIARNNGIPLLHQLKIGPYYLDFAHMETKTAIELDGMQGHSSPDEIQKDRYRQRKIEERGWRFIRFGAKEIFQEAPRCVGEVEAFIRKGSSRS